MKHIIAVITVLGLFMTSTGFANTAVDNGDMESKIESILSDLEEGGQSITVQKLILRNILKSYGMSNIDNPDLKGKVEYRVVHLNPALTPKERSEFNRLLTKIN